MKKNLLFTALLSVGALFALVGCNGGSPADAPVECTIKIAGLYNVSLKYENGDELILNDKFKAASGTEIRLNIFRDESYKYETIDFTDNAGSPVSVRFNHEYVENSDKSLFIFKVPKVSNLSLSIEGLNKVFAKNGLIYDNYDTGVVSVIGYLTKHEIGDELAIPATVDYDEAGQTGLVVDYIAPNVFNDPATINSTKLYIGKNVKTISSYAFANFASLKNVYIPIDSSLIWIGDYAFEYDDLELLAVIPSSTEYIGYHAITAYRKHCTITVLDKDAAKKWTIPYHFVGNYDVEFYN